MRAPSLYTHFRSKHAIYDAMFGQAWSEYERVAHAELADLPTAPRQAVRRIARVFFEFAVANPPRQQLMNQRTIPGFEPSPDSYAAAVRVLESARNWFDEQGVSDPDFEIWVALIGGLTTSSWPTTREARTTPRCSTGPSTSGPTASASHQIRRRDTGEHSGPGWPGPATRSTS